MPQLRAIGHSLQSLHAGKPFYRFDRLSHRGHLSPARSVRPRSPPEASPTPQVRALCSALHPKHGDTKAAWEPRRLRLRRRGWPLHSAAAATEQLCSSQKRQPPALLPPPPPRSQGAAEISLGLGGFVSSEEFTSSGAQQRADESRQHCVSLGRVRLSTRRQRQQRAQAQGPLPRDRRSPAEPSSTARSRLRGQAGPRCPGRCFVPGLRGDLQELQRHQSQYLQ